MSLSGFLFGNVDENGRIDDEQLDDELKRTLAGNVFLGEHLEGALDLLAQASTASSSEGATVSIEEPADLPTVPNKDAIDYSEINEMAEVAPEAPPLPSSLSSLPTQAAFVRPTMTGSFLTSRDSMFSRKSTDDYDEDDNYEVEDGTAISLARPGQRKDGSGLAGDGISQDDGGPPLPCVPETPEERMAKLARYFPGYVSGGTLRFSEWFASKIQRVPRVARVTVKDTKSEFYLSSSDDRIEFLKMNIAPPEEECIRWPPCEPADPVPSHDANPTLRSESSPTSKPLVYETWSPDMMPIVLDSWEDEIVWDIPPALPEPSKPAKPPFLYRNSNLENDRSDWADEIIWDIDGSETVPGLAGTADARLIDDPMVLTMEPLVSLTTATSWSASRHPHFGKSDQTAPSFHPESIPTGEIAPANTGTIRPSIDRFNISDDHYYEIDKSLKAGRTRQTFGPVTLQHSLPAIRIQPPHFKPYLAVKDLRSFHRPSLRFPVNEDIRFSRVKSSKKKKFKGKDMSELLKSTKDITLKDTSKFILFEYCEEYPPIISNTGMATLIYDYYRKLDDKDAFVPNLEVGEPYCLEQVDASPFHGFGDVVPGQILQAISNNMVRGPCFKQVLAETDYLVIRQRYKGQTKYYIRDIPMIFTIGQLFPLIDVPRPQSRKITATIKGRLQVAAYRLMRKDPARRLNFEKLMKAFPGHSEVQIRQRLKEFAQFQRKGENTGWWKLKAIPNGPPPVLPTEEEMRKMLTPEMVCLYESMLAGEQRLRDAGYDTHDIITTFAEEEKEYNEEDIEIRLAPWTITRNFVMATQGKGMLKIYGPGDPTGREEGFSFIRASMKEMFFRSSDTPEERAAILELSKAKNYHKFSISEQQEVYKEEINRIWNAQLKALSSTLPIEDDDEEISKMKVQQKQREMDEEKERKLYFGSGAVAASPAPHSPPPLLHYGTGYGYNEGKAYSVAESMTSKTSRPVTNKDHAQNKLLIIKRLIRENGELVWKSEVISDPAVKKAYLRQRDLIESQMAQGGDAVANNRPEDVRKKRKQLLQDLVKKMKHDHGKEVKEVKDAKEAKGKRRLATADANKEAANSGNPSPATLKVSASSGAGSKKRKKEPQLAEPAVPPLISAQSKPRRRGSPIVDLAAIMEAAIAELIGIDTYYIFCVPVPVSAAPDYYDVIRNPKTLEQIREDIRAFRYKTVNECIEQLKIVVENCRMYNGLGHPYSLVAEEMFARAIYAFSQKSEEISKLEAEIVEFESKSVAAELTESLSKPLGHAAEEICSSSERKHDAPDSTSQSLS
ncbi:uncharacterized protein BJ171DRAFT_97528 [Polychytrium aggregatum]|uniref:uncharacterized protein n=1 Tax=Polychytrium aggregatum TaxID=110093 RepID=UPI0022FF006E|nr:uncharacterized protein BJ171DRAFT_97528 [Polychytrium aggregatum]KAI9204546.1 hypothetical protein BJ171DRAFT_97528 [Polychytrium aggregatum]